MASPDTLNITCPNPDCAVQSGLGARNPRRMDCIGREFWPINFRKVFIYKCGNCPETRIIRSYPGWLGGGWDELSSSYGERWRKIGLGIAIVAAVTLIGSFSFPFAQKTFQAAIIVWQHGFDASFPILIGVLFAVGGTLYWIDDRINGHGSVGPLWVLIGASVFWLVAVGILEFLVLLALYPFFGVVQAGPKILNGLRILIAVLVVGAFACSLIYYTIDWFVRRRRS